MSNLHPLETEGQRTDGEIRLLALPVRTALDVQRADSFVSEAPASTTGSAGSSQGMACETTLVLTIKHNEPLPELFKAIVEQRAYDWLQARGIRADVGVSVEVTEGV
jgi:hypothetical protein